MLARLAAVCYRRRWRILIAWVLTLVIVNVLAQTVGGDLLKVFKLPGTESQRTFDVLGQKFDQKGDIGELVYRAKGDVTVRDPQVRAALDPLIAELRRQPHVVSVTTQFDPGGERLISQTDPKIAYAEILFDVQPNDVPIDLAKHMRSIVKDANSATLQAELGGSMFVDQTQPASEALGLLAAVIILLIAFGSLLAMGLPIITALFGIAIGIACLELLANVLDMPSFAPQVTIMIALGVGIDYALFISTRYREALHAGAEPEAAVVHALDTSGRAVLFAGSTVVISVLGLCLVGVAFIRGMAIAASLAVLIVMLASVTLLPAILGFVGRNIDKFSIRKSKKEVDPEQTFWARWSRVLQKQPWPWAVGGLVLLLVLAAPFISMRLGVADNGNDPTKMTTRRAYDLMSEGFGPGFNGPLILASTAQSPADIAAMKKLAEEIQKDPGVAGVSPVQTNTSNDAVRVFVVPKESPQDQATTELVHRLRDKTVPAGETGTGLNVHVGGQTALGVDLADTLGQRLPFVFLAILVLSFMLLMIVFRSILVPLKAVIMNLLSIGAAYGVIVAIFQWGWLKGVVGIGKEGPIEAWVPMMLFAIVFGLSMDYEVFLLSRIKEEYDATHNNADAVAHGLAKTARLITAAAAIMIAVFASFILSDMRVLKLVGFGLAFAVFIDATVVRMILVPATMELLGDRNWWLPRWLNWLPRVNVEGKPLAIEPRPQAEPTPLPVGD
jgi:RND superfamily putative drug exporter